jgi:protein-S-isoprenylcysteine O-methyltransferase Ste14
MLFNLLDAACWGVFIVYWAVSALSAKRTISNNFTNSLWWRFGILVLVVLFFHFFGIRLNVEYRPSEVLGTIGVICTALGIALAVWARVYLASNWGMPMSIKENPELVTTGPYAYVRHPIYTGVLLGMLGSALVVGPIWSIILIVAVIWFIYSAIQEERLMLKEFPDQYLAYRARTKMLIPFVF